MTKMMTARAGDEFDTTQLHVSRIGYSHRDYIAHCFRYGFAARRIKGLHRVLDAGCGQAVPLGAEMTQLPGTRAKLYVGCDLNRTLKPLVNASWMELYAGFDFTKQWKELQAKYGKFDYVVSLEVLEHMAALHQGRYLKACRELCEDDGELILSTPVFNGRAAKNHVRELTVDELAKLLDKSGFEVVDRFGTFASYHDVKKELTKEVRAQYERLREFYGDSVLACFLAPAFPDQSRNNTWICKPK